MPYLHVQCTPLHAAVLHTTINTFSPYSIYLGTNNRWCLNCSMSWASPAAATGSAGRRQRSRPALAQVAYFARAPAMPTGLALAARRGVLVVKTTSTYVSGDSDHRCVVLRWV